MICSVRMSFLCRLALALSISWIGAAGAVGFGDIRVQSSLGQPFNASIALIGSDTAELTSTCIKTRLQSADGAALGNALVAISRGQRGAAILLSTRQPVNEPAIKIDVNITCGPLVHRDFSILLDPVGMLPAIQERTESFSPDTEAPIRQRERPSARRKRLPAAVSAQGETDVVPRQSVAGAATLSTAGTAGRTNKLISTPLAAAKAPAPKKSVLKLSNEGFTDAELASMGHLKLSASMAESAPLAEMKDRDGLQAARNRFAQVLRGEDPTQAVDVNRTADLLEMAQLKSQMATILKQRASDRVALEEIKKQSMPRAWLVPLLGLVLLSLLVAGWLAWRLMVAKKQTSSAWDMALASQDSSHDRAERLEPVVPVFVPAPVAQSRTASVATEFGHNPPTATKTGTASGYSKEASTSQSDLTERIVVAPNKPVTAVTEATPPIPVIAAAHADALQFYPSKIEHLKVEEISDVMQEAEFWMSLNDPHRAMEILEPYANLEAPDSPMPWLYLLDLYRGTGEQLKYTILQGKMTRVFNARIPLWDEDGDITDGRTLEDFPHVVEQICARWETNDIFDYLESLIYNKREEMREGFDLAVYQDIMMLMAMARSTGRNRDQDPSGNDKMHGLAIE